MKAMFLAAVVCAAVAVPSEDTTLGAGVTMKEGTPIAALTARPQEFVGKTIRIDGIATAVCEAMGCWMAVKAGDGGGATVRLKVEDGVIVFPVSAKGKHVSAEGVFEQVGAKGTEDMDPKASATYQIKATGAIIRGS